MTVKLPGARKKDKGKKARNGTVVFDTKADSVNAAVPAEGGVQLWTHIRNKRAPENYRYCADDVTFLVTPDGGAIGINQANQPVTLVPPPTATEKKTDLSIATSYKAEGNCLVQYVAHKAKGVSYPVLADPWWLAPAVIAGALQAAFYACGIGYLGGMAWHIAWGGSWAWEEVRRSGRQGCVEAAVGRFLPWGWIKQVFGFR
jgi:hypothetical protein